MNAGGDWKRVLQRLLDQHNSAHALRAKTVSHRTMEARAEGLFRIFALLRALGYKVDPTGLGGRHVAHLVRHWCALPPPPGAAPAPGGAPAARRYSPAYIQQQLSLLRVLAGWLGKHGMVLPAERYVPADQRALVTRDQMAASDHGMAARQIDADELIARVSAIDPWVGVQLGLMRAFGMRRKEAVMFCPQAAEVPAWALPAGAQADTRYLAFLRIKRGTKGGRLRFTPLRNEVQAAALAAALAIVGHPGAHVGRPGRTLKQSLDRFSYVVRKAGLTADQLGATSHGMRHQFAGDLYVELTGVAPPVRGGYTDAERMRQAYLEVANQLGHNRPQISGAYLGSRRRQPRGTP